MPKQKPPKLTDHEREEFRQSMDKVKPISQDKRKPESKAPKAKRPSQQSEPLDPIVSHPISLDYLADDAWVGAEDTLEFFRSGLQHREFKRLKKGQIPFTARLDLHKHTIEEAEQRVERLFQDHRCVLIIHGKGHYSAGKMPLLKNWLNQWLQQHPRVLAFCSAMPKDGGRGAMYILLKTRGAIHAK